MKLLTRSQLEHKLNVLTFMTWFEPKEEGNVGYYEVKRNQCERTLKKMDDKRDRIVRQYRELLRKTIGGYTNYD